MAKKKARKKNTSGPHKSTHHKAGVLNVFSHQHVNMVDLFDDAPLALQAYQSINSRIEDDHRGLSALDQAGAFFVALVPSGDVMLDLAEALDMVSDDLDEVQAEHKARLEKESHQIQTVINRIKALPPGLFVNFGHSGIRRGFLGSLMLFPVGNTPTE